MKRKIVILIVVCFCGVALGQKMSYVSYDLGDAQISIPNIMRERREGEEKIMKSIREQNGVKELKKKLRVNVNIPTSVFRFNLKGWNPIAGSFKYLATKMVVRITRKKMVLWKCLLK